MYITQGGRHNVGYNQTIQRLQFQTLMEGNTGGVGVPCVKLVLILMDTVRKLNIRVSGSIIHPSGLSINIIRKVKYEFNPNWKI